MDIAKSMNGSSCEPITMNNPIPHNQSVDFVVNYLMTKSFWKRSSLPLHGSGRGLDAGSEDS